MGDLELDNVAAVTDGKIYHQVCACCEYSSNSLAIDRAVAVAVVVVVCREVIS